MDLWNWDEASLQEVPPEDKLTGLGKLLWLGAKCMQDSKDAGPLTPNLALTSLLPAERAEFGFYFPEVALQEDTQITPMSVDSCWKGGCWVRTPGVLGGRGRTGHPGRLRRSEDAEWEGSDMFGLLRLEEACECVAETLLTSFLNSALLSNIGFPELDWNPALPHEEVPFEAGEW